MQNLQKQRVLKVEFSFALEAAHNEDACGSDGIAPSIFQLGTKGNNIHCTMDRRLGGHQSWSGQHGREISSSVSTLLTELSKFCIN